MRAVIYARVSTHDQNTIPMQVKKCREYAKARNWIVSHVMKDIAFGAKQRPQRDDILKLARKREIDFVIVWKLDRWGRSYIRNTILHTGILAFKNQKRIIKVGESPSLHYWGGEFLDNLRERYIANYSYTLSKKVTIF